MRNEEILTRKIRFTEARTMSVLLQVEGGIALAEVCREHAISTATFLGDIRCPVCCKVPILGMVIKRRGISGSSLQSSGLPKPVIWYHYWLVELVTGWMLAGIGQVARTKPS